MELLFPSGRQPNANSTIAIDVDTGKIVWYYQHVPNDSWDFDSISENIPFDYKKDGKVTMAVAMFHKDGFFYVNDRTTGKLLSAIPFVEKITWASKIDLATGKPVETGNRPGNPAGSPGGKKGTTVWTVPNFGAGRQPPPRSRRRDRSSRLARNRGFRAPDHPRPQRDVDHLKRRRPGIRGGSRAGCPPGARGA
jgi:hypothetical protein